MVFHYDLFLYSYMSPNSPYEMNTGLVWYSNGRFVSGFQMVRYSKGFLKTQLKNACLWGSMKSAFSTL